MSVGRLFFLLAFLSLAASLLPAQTAPSAATPQPPLDSSLPIPTIHVTSRIVVLDVTVTNGYGKVIQGLKPSDFTILEDGVPQKLASFTEHTAAADAETAPTLPLNTFAVRPPIPPDRTRTVLVLASNTPYVRSQIKQYMKTVPSGAAIAIIKIDSLGTHLVQDFTTDPKALQEAAASQRILPPLGFVPPSQVKFPNVRGLARYLATIPGRINVVWFGGGDVPIAQMETEFSDLSSFVRNVDGATNVLHLSRVAVFPVDSGGTIVPAKERADFDLDPLFNIPPLIATPGEMDSWALQGTGLFSGHISPEQSDINDAKRFFVEDNLSKLAASTGGKNFYNNNDFKSAIQEVVDSGANYYTISYTPTNPDWNGKIRRIKIEIPQDLELAHESTWQKLQDVVGEQPARLRYRNYYYARTTPVPTPDSSFTADPTSQRTLISYSPKGAPNPLGRNTPLQQAMGFGADTPNQVNFTISVAPSAEIEKPKADTPASGNFLGTPFTSAPYRNYGVHYWIDPKDLQFSRPANGSYRDDLRFIAIVYADDGAIANSVSTTAHIQVPASNLQSILIEGVTFDQTIAIPIRADANAPNFYLRTAVTETSTSHIGALEIPVESIHLPSAQTLATAK